MHHFTTFNSQINGHADFVDASVRAVSMHLKTTDRRRFSIREFTPLWRWIRFASGQLWIVGSGHQYSAAPQKCLTSMPERIPDLHWFFIHAVVVRNRSALAFGKNRLSLLCD
jgi:hypothetical protein